MHAVDAEAAALNRGLQRQPLLRAPGPAAIGQVVLHPPHDHAADIGGAHVQVLRQAPLLQKAGDSVEEIARKIGVRICFLR